MFQMRHTLHRLSHTLHTFCLQWQTLCTSSWQWQTCSPHFLSSTTKTHSFNFYPQWQTHTLCTFCLQWQTHTLHFLSTVTNAHSLHAFGLEHLLTEKHSASFVCSDKLTLSTVCLQWQTNSALFVYPEKYTVHFSSAKFYKAQYRGVAHDTVASTH